MRTKMLIAIVCLLALAGGVVFVLIRTEQSPVNVNTPVNTNVSIDSTEIEETRVQNLYTQVDAHTSDELLATEFTSILNDVASNSSLTQVQALDDASIRTEEDRLTSLNTITTTAQADETSVAETTTGLSEASKN